MSPRVILPLVAVVAWLLASSTAAACNIPVFRYALERWPADPYEVIIFHRGPLSADLVSAVDELRQADSRATANVNTVVVDLAATVEKPLQQLWEAQGEASLPWMVVRYPRRLGIENSVWAGSLSTPAVHSLLHSPKRAEMTRRLMEGQSAVWLLLESGDAEKDAATARLLETELARLEKELKLPDADAPPLEQGRQRPEAPNAGPVESLSDLPLNIRFSLLRLARNDPAEKMLIDLLLRAHQDLTGSKEPILFPVFGRGRALEAFVGEEINARTIEAAATFVCGACSCTVKGLNPGVDLLCSADWNSVLKEAAVVAPSPREPITFPRPSTTATDTTEEEAEPTPRGKHVRNLLLAAIGVTCVLVIVSGVLAFRSGKKNGNASGPETRPDDLSS